jgi:diamine N-acetyltransferase
MTRAVPFVRRATTGDAPSLAAFAAITFPLGCPPDTDPADLAAFTNSELTRDRFLQHLETPGVTILIAEVTEDIAGYLMLVENCPHPKIKSEHPLEIRKMYVHPKHHGDGVAAALMQTAATQFGESDAIWLSVYSKNTRAISFYKKCGFEVVGTQQFLVGSDAQLDFVMQRKQAGKK